MTTNNNSSMQEMDTNPVQEELDREFQESKWWTIPHHILHNIFYSLPVKDIVSASGVCRRWREIASDELLWKKKMHRHFRIDPALPLKPGAESWRSEYVRLACEIPFIQTQSIRGHAHQVLHVSFSHNGEMFATCSKDGYVIVWNSDHPCREKYAHNMKEFNWKYTQFSQFNQSDTLLMVSGVHFGSPHSTSGEIAVFTVYGESHLRCRVVNRPYDIFGTWFSDQYLIAGDLIWLAHLVSTSRLLLNKANQETASEHVPITCELFKFLNLSASSVRAIMIARCPWLNDENDPLPQESKQNKKESTSNDEVPTTSNSVQNLQEQTKAFHAEGLPDVAQQSTSKTDVDSATIRYAEAYLKNIKFSNDYELTSSDDDEHVVENSNDENTAVDDSDMDNDIEVQEQTQLDCDDEDDDNEDMSSDEMENHIPKYLIFSMGSKTYTPHQIGIKRIRNVNFPKRLDPGLPLRDRLAARRAAQRQVRPEPAISAVQNFNTPDKIIDLHGHIVGMALSPDHRYLYVNTRPWPQNYVISSPLEPPPIAQEIDIQVIDLMTLNRVGNMLRSHKAYTPSTESFFIFLDVCNNYVASGAEDMHAYLWDRYYGICLAKYKHSDVVNSVGFNPADSEMLVTTSDDYKIKIWRSRSKAKQYKLNSLILKEAIEVNKES